MTEYISAAGRISFCREGTYAQLPAGYTGGSGGGTSPRLWGIIDAAVELPDKEVEMRQHRNIGTGRRYFTTVPGKRTRAGSITYMPTTPETFLFAMVGRADQTPAFDGYSVTSLGGAPTVYQHVLRPANVGKLASYSLAVALTGSPDFQRIFTGCQIDSLNFTLTETAELEASVEFRAKDVVNEDQATPTLFTQPSTDAFSTPYSTTPIPYMFYDRTANVSVGGTYNYSTNTYSGGRTLARVRSFNFGISNNLKELYFTQNQNAQDVFDFALSYPDFDLTIEVVPAGKLSGDTDSIYDLLQAETGFDVVIPFTRSTGDTLNFVFDNCRIKQAPHPLPEDGGEISTQVELTVDEFRIVATDRVADYTAL